MIRAFLFILIIYVYAFSLKGQDVPDNVQVNEETVTYRIIARDGKPELVKVDEQQVFEAHRSDDAAIALSFYNDYITIDKASAPNTKPVYRKWDDDDIFYDDSRVCALPLDLKRGKPVKAEFKSTITKPEHFTRISLARNNYTAKSRIEVIIPPELANQIILAPHKFIDNMSMVKTTGPKGETVYTVTATDIKRYKREKYSNSAVVDEPSVLVHGIFEGPNDLYTYYRRYLPDYSSVAPEVAELAKKITSGAPNDIAKVDSIAAWVRHNIRYVAIEHGDYGVSPAPPAEVLANRYGDCKGSASLLKSMMQACDIDGRLVWIGTASHSDQTWESHPAMSTGNHMIAAALIGDSIIYVDGTAEFVPDGYIPASLRGQQAMIEDGDKCLLRTVPTPAPSHYLVKVAATVDDNNLKGRISHNLTGDYKARINSIFGSTPLDKRETVINQLASHGRKNMFANGAWKSDDSIVADFVDREAVQTVGKNTYVKLSPVWQMFCDIFDTKDRRFDAKFRYTENAESEYTFTVPEGMTVKSVPQPFATNDEWFDASIKYDIADGIVKCKAHLLMKQTDIPYDKVEQWNNSLKSILKASGSRVVLEKTI